MKRYSFIGLLLLLSNLLPAQVNLEKVLESIAANNKTLQAGERLAQTQKLEARTGNYLANPTVELNQLWADKSTGGNVNELAVVQSFDFPSVYAHKNKLIRLKSNVSDYQFALSRQQILLTAQQTCLEIVYLRKQHKLLTERLANATRLSELYQSKLERGDANQLELNKVRLEWLDAQNRLRLNQTALTASLEQLQNLNGGIPLSFPDEEYSWNPLLPEFEQLQTEYFAADPSLKDLGGQSEIAEREIRLTRAQSLPKFDIGYRRNGGSAEKLNGFRIGMSIPLWENKNTVKSAKARYEYTHALLDDKMQSIKSALQQLYQQARTLENSKEEYARILSTQHNIELLNKALEAGQISMIDYFVEATTLYDSQQNYLDVEKDYYITLSQLLQYKL